MLELIRPLVGRSENCALRAVLVLSTHTLPSFPSCSHPPRRAIVGLCHAFTLPSSARLEALKLQRGRADTQCHTSVGPPCRALFRHPRMRMNTSPLQLRSLQRVLDLLALSPRSPRNKTPLQMSRSGKRAALPTTATAAVAPACPGCPSDGHHYFWRETGARLVGLGMWMAIATCFPCVVLLSVASIRARCL